jgi:acyl-CoA synthetase (AMP-forming)/AMP-acid ligase II
MFRGPLVMLGYYGNEAGTVATIEPDGWLHTEDVATMDEDGYFTIVDRIKDMILTAGFDVYPAEIERALCTHPAVALAAVCGNADETKASLRRRMSSSSPQRMSHARNSSPTAVSISRRTRFPGRSSSRKRCR